MDLEQIRKTFTFELEGKELLIFRALATERLNKAETDQQAKEIMNKLAELITPDQNYNFLVFLGDKITNITSGRAIGAYQEMLDTYHFHKIAVVTKHASIMSFASTVMRFSDTKHQFKFFIKEEDARAWLKSSEAQSFV